MEINGIVIIWSTCLQHDKYVSMVSYHIMLDWFYHISNELSFQFRKCTDISLFEFESNFILLGSSGGGRIPAIWDTWTAFLTDMIPFPFFVSLMCSREHELDQREFSFQFQKLTLLHPSSTPFIYFFIIQIEILPLSTFFYFFFEHYARI